MPLIASDMCIKYDFHMPLNRKLRGYVPVAKVRCFVTMVRGFPSYITYCFGKSNINVIPPQIFV